MKMLCLQASRLMTNGSTTGLEVKRGLEGPKPGRAKKSAEKACRSCLDQVYTSGYIRFVKNTLNRTEIFATWLRGLRNITAKVRIFARLDAAREGNFGDWRSVGDGIFEMRVDLGAGYRIYYAREDIFVYLLLAGGDKRTQDADIKAARKMWQKIQEEQK